MKNRIILFTIIFLFFSRNFLFSSVKRTIIEDRLTKIIIEIDIDAVSEADLYPTTLLIGMPNDKIPKTNISYSNKTKIQFESNHNLVTGFDWINKQKLKNLHTGSLRISPFCDKNHYYKKIEVFQ